MKIFLAHWNSVMLGVHQRLLDEGHEVVTDGQFLENPKGIDAGLFWNETTMGNNVKHWREFVEEWNKKKIPTYLYQHGRFGTSRIFPPFNENLLCSKALLWGESDRKRYESVGTSPERIKVVGCPLFQTLIPRVKQDKPTIVFCPEHWGDEVEENLAVAQELRKLGKVNIITKVLKGNHHLPWYDNPIETDRNTPEHLKVVAEVLSKADVIVSVFASTFELLAQSLDIPVVVVDLWRPKACSGDERYRNYERPMAKGVDRVPLKDLNCAVKFALKHPQYNSPDRKKAVLADGGDFADPIGNIVREVTRASQ